MGVAAKDVGAAPLVEVRLAFGAALPFVLFAWAAQRAPAAIGAISNSMTVLFTATISAATLVGVLCTGLAIVVYCRLIARIAPARAVTVTDLVPLFGVAWAWLLLGEPLTLTMGVAGAMILGSMALSQRVAK